MCKKLRAKFQQLTWNVCTPSPRNEGLDTQNRGPGGGKVLASKMANFGVSSKNN